MTPRFPGQPPPIRVVITDSGSGDHSAEALARGLRDAGLEVVFVGTGLDAPQLITTVVQEDADALVICGRSDLADEAWGALDGVRIFTSDASLESILDWSRSR
jgi:methylmalonyl-CoA mutase cobalamin-binding subunit